MIYLLSSQTENGMEALRSNYQGAFIGIILISLGSFIFKVPKFFWILSSLSRWWWYKDNTPSEDALKFIKAIGIFISFMGIIFILDYFFA